MDCVILLNIIKVTSNKVKLSILCSDITRSCFVYFFFYFSGAVKITPAHDHNDYGVGQRHNLPFVTMIDDSGNIKNLKDFYPEFQHFAVSCLPLCHVYNNKVCLLKKE